MKWRVLVRGHTWAAVGVGGTYRIRKAVLPRTRQRKRGNDNWAGPTGAAREPKKLMRTMYRLTVNGVLRDSRLTLKGAKAAADLIEGPLEAQARSI